MTSLLEKIFNILGIAGGAGTIGKYLYENAKSKQKAKQREIVNERVQLVNLANYWREEFERLSKEHRECVDIITDLKIDLALTMQKRDTIPLAMWEKDEKGRLIWASKEYERLFLLPLGKKLIDYLYLTDEEFWGPEIGRAYYERDRWCIENRTNWYGIESLRMGGKELLTDFKVYKNIIVYEGEIKGTLGVALKLNEKIEKNG